MCFKPLSPSSPDAELAEHSDGRLPRGIPASRLAPACYGPASSPSPTAACWPPPQPLVWLWQASASQAGLMAMPASRNSEMSPRASSKGTANTTSMTPLQSLAVCRLPECGYTPNKSWPDECAIKFGQDVHHGHQSRHLGFGLRKLSIRLSI
jgi:hypothetical protein